MSEPFRVDTLKFKFDRNRPRPISFEFESFLEESVKLNSGDIIGIHMSLLNSEVFVKLRSAELCDKVVQSCGGTFKYKHRDGHIGDVEVNHAGSRIRTVRIFELPFEVSAGEINAVVSMYGKVLSNIAEKWSAAHKFPVLNGIRQLKVDLQRHIPSYINVCGYRAIVSYDGQPRTCAACGKQGHVRAECLQRRVAHVPAGEAAGPAVIKALYIPSRTIRHFVSLSDDFAVFFVWCEKVNQRILRDFIVSQCEMVGCAAPNCSNNSRHGRYKFYRFPADIDRRKRWLVNSRRQDWTPTSNNFLCNVHFEESQFEQNRADKKKKLKPNAIPTLFDVPNPPLPIDIKRNSIYKKKGPCGSSESIIPAHNPEIQMVHNLEQAADSDVVELRNRIAVLEHENSSLKEQLTRFDRALSTFLTSEQISRLGCNTVRKWSEDNIVKGLKLRFVLGKEGYNYLRKSGYPSPSYGTLNNHIRGVQLHFGIFDFIFVLLRSKVAVMKDFEKDCVLMIDEMEISGSIQYDNIRKNFCGSVTLGNISATGNHLTVAILRGITSKWKQVVAAHVTGPSTPGNDTKTLILALIEKAREIGLHVCAVVSDMGGMNRSLWCALGVSVTRSERRVSFHHASSDIYVLADVPHLVKNWRSAMQSGNIVIPQSVADKEGLPSTVVTSEFISKLWAMELSNESGLRSLHHLSKSCLSPSHYEKMNVGLALRYLSLKTASALEMAVNIKILPPEALTTAWFIRFLNEWFTLLMSRSVKTSVTKKNFERKLEFLQNFVNVVDEMKIGDSGWKPLNTGSLMSTLSFISLAKAAFSKGYGFLMGSRFSQDAIENIFSQIRKKAGMNPSALDARKALKLITVTQFMTPCSNTNYCSDSDRALLSFSDTSQKSHKSDIQNNLPGPSMSTDELTDIDINNVHYIAGASVHAVLKKSVCDECRDFLTKNGHDVPQTFTKLSEFSDLGGLKFISPVGLDILKTAEMFMKKYRDDLLSANIGMQAIVNFVCDLYTEVPHCCDVVKQLVSHYADVRGFGVSTYLATKRKLQTTYGNRHKKQK